MPAVTGRLSALLCIPVAFCISCASAQDLDRQTEELARLKQEIRANQQLADKDRDELRQRFSDSNRVVSKNSADYGVQIERLSTRITKLEGHADETQRNLELLQQQVKTLREANAQQSAATSSATSSDIPETADAHYRMAHAKLAEGSYIEARKLFRSFIERYPKEPRRAAAQYGLGDSYYAETKFGPAVAEYRKVIVDYSKSEYVGDALYKTGSSFYQLKWCSDAEVALLELTKLYPRHSRVRDAKKLLKLINKYRKNRRFCAS